MNIRTILSLTLLTFFAITTHSQSVGIAGTTITPNASSMLEIQSNNKGLLIPRIALTSTTVASPVTTPATSLLVYNTATAGDVTPGYYYWGGSKWVRLLSGSVCNTLDGAYDCGGNGSGRLITCDAGAVNINVPATSNSTAGLDVIVDNGTASALVAGVSVSHNTNYGAGIYGETTSTGNYFSGIQGLSQSSNTSTSDYPAGVSGYFGGDGIGVGVWGQTDATVTTTGTGAGIYGNGQGSKNYGGWFYSSTYPGINVQTASSTSQAAQIVSAGTSPLNPALMAVGKAQFNCSSNANCGGILMNQYNNNPALAPFNGGYGYLGYSGVYWYYTYSQNVISASRRELKRNIMPFDRDLYTFSMEEIMKLKPSLYKFKNENDEMIEGKEAKTRYNLHLGLILDETPDYLQDNAFSGIDVYALSTLNLAGIQYLNKEVESIKSWAPVTDFGCGNMTTTEVRINYSNVLTGNVIDGTPVVSITPTSAGARYYVKSQDKTGFVLVSENGPMSFNWTANARKAVVDEEYNIADSTMSQLRVDPSKKAVMIEMGRKPQEEPMKILGNDDPSDNHSFRMKPQGQDQ